MITTTMTADEMKKELQKDDSLIEERVYSFLERNATKIRRENKRTGKLITISKSLSVRSNENLYWINLVGCYAKTRKTGIEVQANNISKSSILCDSTTGNRDLYELVTGKNEFEVHVYSAHFIKRYNQRYFEGKLTFEEACDTLLKRNNRMLVLVKYDKYGKTGFLKCEAKIEDGVALGYYDDKKNIYHFCTFVSDNLLVESQEHLDKESIIGNYVSQLVHNEQQIIKDLPVKII